MSEMIILLLSKTQILYNKTSVFLLYAKRSFLSLAGQKLFFFLDFYHSLPTEAKDLVNLKLKLQLLTFRLKLQLGE